MARIEPFKGLIITQAYRPRASRIVCPIYDQISKNEIADYEKLSPRNIVRYEMAEDGGKARRFREKLFKAEPRVYAQSKNPSFYIYGIRYRDPFGEDKMVYSLLATVEIEGGRGIARQTIYDHENIFEEKMRKRFEILKEGQVFTNAVAGLIVHSRAKGHYIGLFKEVARARQPLYSIRFKDQIHTIWEVSDIETIERIKKELNGITIMIADGHHRYGASELLRANHITDFTMMLLTDMHDPSVNFLGRQRLVRFGLEKLQELAARDREVETRYELLQFPDIKRLKKLLQRIGTFSYGLDEINEQLTKSEVREKFVKSGEGLVFGIYSEKRPYLLRIILPEEEIDRYMGMRERMIMKDFDFDVYDVLHTQVIDKLGATEKEDKANSPTVDECVKLVDSGEYKLAFFLPIIGEDLIQLVMRRAISFRKKVRQKATCILPKPISGLVMHYFLSLRDSKEYKKLAKVAREYVGFLKEHNLFAGGGLDLGKRNQKEILRKAEELYRKVIGQVEVLEKLGFSRKTIEDTLLGKDKLRPEEAFLNPEDIGAGEETPRKGKPGFAGEEE